MRHHLAGAERLARGWPISLEPTARANRALLLDELTRYRRRGRFPRNTLWRSKQVPQFIDEHGTPCAVAHLMTISGQGEIVRHIAQFNNAARIRELAHLPELRAWLAAAGLRLEEAARIQPAYDNRCEHDADACACTLGIEGGVAVGTVLQVEPDTFRVRIERVEGSLEGLQVGDERTVRSSGALNEQGEQVLISLDPAGDSESALAVVLSRLEVAGDTTLCRTIDGYRGPVSTDLVLQALTSEHADCVGVFSRIDSEWLETRCENGGDVAPGNAVTSGCGLVPGGAGLGGVELTSVALLAALIQHRRRRRPMAP